MKKILSKYPVLQILCIALVVGIFFESILYFILGQRLLSPSGKVELWSFVINGKESSQQITDWYTPSHIIHGILFYAFYKYLFPRLQIWQIFIMAVATEGVWEVVENTNFVISRYREVTIGSEYFGDSILNSFSDILYCSLGFVMAYKLTVKWVVIFVLFSEFFVGYMIRDNLTLNVLMLLYPLEIVKNWQLAL